MKQQMFQQLLEKSKSTRRWLYVPLSVLFHGMVIAVVVVYPLISEAIQLPEVKVIELTLVAPAPPSVPVGRRGGGGRSRANNQANTTANQPPVVHSGRLVAIVNIPDEIQEERLDSFGNGLGFGPGIPEGSPDGIEDGIPGAQTFLLGDRDLKDQVATRITNIQQPRLLRKVEPLYPRAAILSHTEGMVIIEAVTDISGNVVKTNVISGHPLLRPAAVEAVRKWIYEPYMYNGIPKPVIFTVNVTFKLQR